MARKNCFIIGNGNLPRTLSARIDAADYVLRFNEPPLATAGAAGAGIKTDCLMLCNSGKPMQLKLASEQFHLSPFFMAAEEVILVYHPAIIRRFFKKPLITSRLLQGRKRDWTKQALEKLGGMGKKITILPPQFYLEACADLGLKGDDLKHVFPSTGYLGIHYVLQQYPLDEWHITLTGFSWQGWKRHAWAAEESWVRAQITAGRLTFIEPE